jgi:hypothetical protein
MTRHRRAFGLGLGLLCGAAWALPARAYEEQASLDVAVGADLLPQSDTLRSVGPTLDVGASLGLSDMFVLRGALGYALQIESGVQHVGRARVEAAYLIDVLRYVPFFGVGASLWLYDADGITARPAGHVVLGLDFLANRTWTVGLDLRTGLLWEDGGLSSVSEAQLRLSRMFDRF